MRIKAGISVISAIMLLCFHQQVYCQDQGNWDRTLDRYELICERCIELLEQKRSGKDVAQESLSSLLTQLSLLKSSLNEADKQMSPAQKMRFEMIRRRFATIQTGNSDPSGSNFGSRTGRTGKNVTETTAKQGPVAKTTIASSPSLADRHFTPPLPRISSSFLVKVPIVQNQALNALAPKRLTSGSIDRLPDTGSTSLIAPSSPKYEILAGLQVGAFPTITLGGFAAFCPGRYGIYLEGRTDLAGRPPEYSFSLNSDGRIDGGGRIWSDGERIKKRIVATTGAIFKAGPMAVYAGAGYGYYRCFIKETNEQWGFINDLSTKGLSLDIGIMTNLGKHLFAGAGACVTGFKYSELEITLGLRLGNTQ